MAVLLTQQPKWAERSSTLFGECVAWSRPNCKSLHTKIDNRVFVTFISITSTRPNSSVQAPCARDGPAARSCAASDNEHSLMARRAVTRELYLQRATCPQPGSPYSN
ncbi:hypothetical protein EVAR_9080_1 [Eumeta japonica]|uniref:Uncharacterized protein n=1 Tax=Eumeta variegata TaxID=151549 RepID=A0A4C1TWD6_EUMVA|nr:hypothetical protein EVAR_9080_1 [Eumeta japonica]